MLYSNDVIRVTGLSKRYEIYATPRDRLKQLFLPRFVEFFRRLGFGAGKSLGVRPQFFCEFWALNGVTFDVRRGDTVGILGVNGSGKSTLLQIICSTLRATNGKVEVNGRLAALLELGSGFNPEYTGRENVFLNGQLLGLTRKEVEIRFGAIERFADIGEFIDRPVKTYSSGMMVRLAFAVAINVEPEILIVDEALAVGDVAFQRKCLRWMEEFTAGGGVLLFVSHSTEQIRRLCNKAVYLQSGRAVFIGDAKEACDRYEKDIYVRLDKRDSERATEAAVEHTTQENLPVRRNVVVPKMPECAVEYGNGNASITEAWFEDVDGNMRSQFLSGEPFRWCYRIQFNVSVEMPVFGFLVKTKEGLVLYGTNSVAQGVSARAFLAGETQVVRFSIEPNLGAGEYFFNCGVSVDTDESVEFLHRVIDAGVVTIAQPDESSGGLVRMAVSVALSH